MNRLFPRIPNGTASVGERLYPFVLVDDRNNLQSVLSPGRMPGTDAPHQIRNLSSGVSHMPSPSSTPNVSWKTWNCCTVAFTR